MIRNGEFSLEPTAGEKRVEIDAARDVPGETPPLQESYVPEKYYINSKLTATINPNDGNSLTFELTE